MSAYVLPAAYALFLWWFSTGAVLYLDGLPSATFRRTMVAATTVFVASLLGLALTANEVSVGGAYAAFTFGFFAWAWQEISFYLGYITGPRRIACAEGCSGWRHVGHGILVTLHHEIKIIVSAAVILALTVDGTNHLAIWSFVILWGMHQSAKINVFLGVQNLSEDFLPDHLRYLQSFLKRRSMNLLFPVSVTIGTAAAGWVIAQAIAAETGSYDQTALTFIAALLVVGVLEHWFLVLPLPTAALWEWGMKSHHHPHDEPVAAPTVQKVVPPAAAPE